MKKYRNREEFLRAVDAIMPRLFAKRELKVARIAQEMGFSQQKFRRHMFSATGGTCTEYMAKYRLEKAKIYLLDGSKLSIAKVAYLCGFDEPTHFTRFFRNAAGITPGNFRKLAKKMKIDNN